VIVRVLPGGDPEVTLEEPEDLKSLKVTTPVRDIPALARAVSQIGALADDEHAWIRVSALADLAGDHGRDASWQEGFEAMLAYARSKGWMSADGGSVRAHIELAGEAS
jgi:hypothetical protein